MKFKKAKFHRRGAQGRLVEFWVVVGMKIDGLGIVEIRQLNSEFPILGTCTVTVEDDDGNQYAISNSQGGGISFCTQLSSGKIGLLPGSFGIDRLSRDCWKVEFKEPIEE